MKAHKKCQQIAKKSHIAITEETNGNKYHHQNPSPHEPSITMIGTETGREKDESQEEVPTSFCDGSLIPIQICNELLPSMQIEQQDFSLTAPEQLDNTLQIELQPMDDIFAEPIFEFQCLAP